MPDNRAAVSLPTAITVLILAAHCNPCVTAEDADRFPFLPAQLDFPPLIILIFGLSLNAWQIIA